MLSFEYLTTNTCIVTTQNWYCIVEEQDMQQDGFAKRLQQVRLERNYTQQQLANITHISVQTIRNYEQGVSEPISLYLLELAKALDVTPENLLIGENNMHSYSAAIKTELTQLMDFKSIAEIKDSELNSTILSHLEMSEELVSDITEDWNGKSIFKRTKGHNGTKVYENASADGTVAPRTDQSH